MPEGPEIRWAADQVEKALQHRTMLDVSFGLDRLQGYESILQGAQVTNVDTKGKAMLTRFDHGWVIYSHNQLYGKWMIRNAYNYPKTNRQLRLALHNEKKSALLYSASDISVMQEEELSDHPFLQKAGPDLLSDPVTAELLYERIQSASFYRRKWSSLLLDQSFVCGTGNYLRSEIMFTSGLSPEWRPADTPDEKLFKAAEEMIRLTEQAYQSGGITNNLQLAEELKRQGQTRQQYRHYVFARASLSCRECGSPIEKIQAASRRLYYCPYCQSS
ncbi:endonuclease VIII [Alkalicoccus urumqiensis]|uniref:Formamidopyrimidine-DNA glycosylase n=1 Tax=Alkalicoccus urumqiensis TaxID=1548213 RepID=A0A2P6MJ48_ALKUR|nr:endonuclease VIII [Alkalicoccus urumqiensis]PRO66280.1 endonuclease VIII [Alkalicoccus urumqiensis]